MAYAACGSEDPALFYPPGDVDEDSPTWDKADAIAICQSCPVQRECLRWALEKREKWGIWGGMTGKGRSNLLGIRYRARNAAKL